MTPDQIIIALRALDPAGKWIVLAALMQELTQPRPALEPPSSEPDELLTAKQVAVLWNVPETWVREQARMGKLPSIRLGHYVRFRRPDIEVALRNGLTEKSV